jgi:adenosylhomocysteine nucleosidase
MKTLVVTPLQKELDAFVASCTRLGLRLEHSTIGWLSAVWLPELNITLARGGTGKTQFAVQTQHLLDMRLNWDLVICSGAAGSLIDDVSIGDVVVATTTVEHDYNNRFSDRPLPRFEGASSAIAGLGRAASACTLFRVHFGPIASGDEDVVDPERRSALYQKTRALAVAWEGAGGARACAFSCVPFVEIRAVTDAADHSAPAEFEKNLKAAMNNVAVLITSWIWQSQQGADA